MNRFIAAFVLGLGVVTGAIAAADASVPLPIVTQVAGEVAAQAADSASSSGTPSLAPLLKKITPAIVSIAVKGKLDKDVTASGKNRREAKRGPEAAADRQIRAAGSGVVTDPRQGYIVTNNHVVDHAEEITVTLADGREMQAKLVGTDPDTDIAVIKVASDNLIGIAAGDSDKLEVGDFVLAIGNPFMIGQTVTSGIVSGLRRNNVGIEEYEDFIQTDAAIYPGNSGGALVNLRGELVGINSAILSGGGGNIGIGFAIPVNMAKGVMDQLIKYGQVRRGVLGVNIYDVTPDVAKEFGLAEASGALVAGVAQGSSAERAGVKTGDIIVSINGTAVKSAHELRNAIGMMQIGDQVEIGLLRDGKPRKLTAVVAEHGDSQTASAADIHHGLEGAELADAPDSGGVLVRSVQDGSPAAQAGLKANDLILGVGRTPVAGTQALREAAKGVNLLMLNVRRGPSVVLIPIR